MKDNENAVPPAHGDEDVRATDGVERPAVEATKPKWPALEFERRFFFDEAI
jgi:hypothetical protein